MAEQDLNDNEFEAALSRLRPRSAGVERDRVIYLAGRASAESGVRTGLRTSITVAGWLLAAGFCGLWLNHFEPVLVTEMEYIERARDPLPDPSRPDSTVIETTNDGIPDRVDRDTAAPRADRGGRGNDLDALMTSNLIRAGRIPQRGTNRRAGLAGERTGSVRDRPGDSYIELMKVYLDSPGTGPRAGGQL